MRDVKPQKSIGWKSSFEMRTGRKPPYHELFIKIFGAPCSFAPMGGAVHKRGDLTEEGYFVGVQWPMALVMRKTDGKVVSVSRKKVHVYESAYINGDPYAVLQSELQEVGDDLTLQAVKSVKSLRAHSMNEQLMSPTEQYTSKNPTVSD